MAEGSLDDPGRVEALPADRAAVLLDLAGQRIELTPKQARQLCGAASAEAGSSTIARDLSILLGRALTSPQTLALRPGERRVLARIASKTGLHELASRLLTDRG